MQGGTSFFPYIQERSLQVIHDGSDYYSRLWRQHHIIKLLEKYKLNVNLKGPVRNIDLKKTGNIPEKIIKIAEGLGFKLKHLTDCFKKNLYADFIFLHPIKLEVLTVTFENENKVSTEIFGGNISSLRASCEDFISKFTEESKPKCSKELVKFKFWHYFQGRAISYDRVQECLGLEDIEKNYTPSVFKQLKHIQNLDNPEKKGKVIIWHGKPGGGKTYAARALARDWAFRKGASIEIILDPHEFLNQSAYMRQVALSKSYSRYQDNPIRLIILEDHAELFTAKCRESKGLSTILNLTDGILGQGLRLIFLLTANEDIKEIDPAIKRPRRCIGVTEFKGFTLSEAISWAPEAQRAHFRKLLPTLKNKEERYELVDLYYIQDLLKEKISDVKQQDEESQKSVL